MTYAPVETERTCEHCGRVLYDDQPVCTSDDCPSIVGDTVEPGEQA